MPLTWRIGRRGACTAAATTCALTGAALLTLAFTPSTGPPPVPEDAVRAPAADAPPVLTRPSPRPSADGGEVLPASTPTRVTIPRIGLKADIDGVTLNEVGAIALPGDADHAGWYTGSPTPGQAGNAVLVGHVDSEDGPAAFFGLGAAEEGDRILVEREDGHAATYVVDSMSVWPRQSFPSQQVYGPTQAPRLTLLTCTDWDDEQETYLSNLVVTAHLQAKQTSHRRG